MLTLSAQRDLDNSGAGGRGPARGVGRGQVQKIGWLSLLVHWPRGIVEGVRWSLAGLVVASLVLTLPEVLRGTDGWMRLAVAVSAMALGLSWASGYSRRSAPVAMVAVDAVALFVLSASGPEPHVMSPVVFAALWFRSQYGSLRRGLLRAVFYAVAVTASALWWTHVPGHVGVIPVAPLVGAVPTMLLTAVVGWHLAGVVRAREQGALLDGVHVSVGSQLLGTTDPTEIREIAWAAIAQICEVTPGMRVLKVVADGASLRGVRATEGFASVPKVLPGDALSLLGGDGGACQIAIRGQVALDAAAGTSCAWACVSLPEVDDQPGRAWLLVGAPDGVPAQVLVALGSLANQVTLALRNSAVHRDLTVLAELDGLTGLANRASFNSALAQALDAGFHQAMTVLFVDLDDFKDVNDVFGHQAGDQLLCEVAVRLRRATRPGDLCARIGGDEFAVLLRDTGEVGAADIAQRIVRVVSTPAHVADAVVRVGASVGVATATPGIDLETLIHCADVAMYAAKAQGKARVQVFEPGLMHGDKSRMEFEFDLAAAPGNAEFVVHYQPVVSLADGLCTAVEALVRWQHPRRGLLYPDAFIETAERIGVIGDIGSAVLRQALCDVSGWRETHRCGPLAVHVNVSALQLDDDTFTTTVGECLREFAWPPELLVLEFTETVIVSSPDAVDRLNGLAASGVTIAVDGFGAGYSSLTTLRSLPVQVVKIDKSFIAGSTVNRKDRAVTEAITTMVTHMGLRAIAQGVERPEQHEFLASIGVSEAQGYLYLCPQPAEEFGRWLHDHPRDTRTAAGDQHIVLPLTPRQTA